MATILALQASCDYSGGSSLHHARSTAARPARIGRVPQAQPEPTGRAVCQAGPGICPAPMVALPERVPVVLRVPRAAGAGSRSRPPRARRRAAAWTALAYGKAGSAAHLRGRFTPASATADTSSAAVRPSYPTVTSIHLPGKTRPWNDLQLLRQPFWLEASRRGRSLRYPGALGASRRNPLSRTSP